MKQLQFFALPLLVLAMALFQLAREAFVLAPRPPRLARGSGSHP